MELSISDYTFEKFLQFGDWADRVQWLSHHFRAPYTFHPIVLEIVGRDPDKYVKQTCIDIMLHFPSEEHIPILRKLMWEDEYRFNRTQSMAGLLYIQKQEALPEIIKFLREEKNRKEGLNAIFQHFVSYANYDFGYFLMEQLKEEVNPYFLKDLVNIFGRIRFTPAVPYLKKALENPKMGPAKFYIMYALAEIIGVDFLPEILSYPWESESFLINCIDQIRDKNALYEKYRSEVGPNKIRIMDGLLISKAGKDLIDAESISPKSLTLEQKIEKLRLKIEKNPNLEPLNKEEKTLKLFVEEKWSRINPKNDFSKRYILEGIKSHKTKLSIKCSKIAAKHRMEVALPSLEYALSTNLYKNHRFPAMAIGEIGHPDGVEILIEYLKRKIEYPKNFYSPKIKAIESLGKIGEKKGTDILGNVLLEPSKYSKGDPDHVISVALEALESCKTDLSKSQIPTLPLLSASPSIGKKCAVILQQLGWKPKSEEEELMVDFAQRNWESFKTKGKKSHAFLWKQIKTKNEDDTWNIIFTICSNKDYQYAYSILEVLFDIEHYFHSSNKKKQFAKGLSPLFGTWTESLITIGPHIPPQDQKRSRTNDGGYDFGPKSEALKQIKDCESPILPQLLHLILKRPPFILEMDYHEEYGGWDGSYDTKDLKAEAKKILKKLGNPAFDKGVFDLPSNWEVGKPK